MALFHRARNPWLALLVLMILGATGLAQGQDLTSSSPDSVFARISESWEKSDEKALASLVHPDGLRVTHGGDYYRYTIYSPDQAHYYFKDLLDQGESLAFKIRPLSESAEGSDFMGMIEWRFRRSGYKTQDTLKLVVVLARQAERWYMSELNSIAAR